MRYRISWATYYKAGAPLSKMASRGPQNSGSKGGWVHTVSCPVDEREKQ